MRSKKVKRDIINIDEDKCTGCGLCVIGCHEGALQIIDGKARLVNELFCDGLGACIGECPEDAITIEHREAEEYDEVLTIKELLKKSDATVLAHLEHLYKFNALDFYNEGIDYLKSINRADLLEKLAQRIQSGTKKHGPSHGHGNEHAHGSACGCQGSAPKILNQQPISPINVGRGKSGLSHWPVQLHLVMPNAPFFKGTELVVMNTCGGIASANIHQDYLTGRSVIVACPKLDRTEPYAEKLAAIFQNSGLQKVLVVRMEVPCCGGLTAIVKQARQLSGISNLIIEEHTLSLEGELLSMNRV